MTERYSFAVDRHLVDTSVIWSQENVDHVNSTLGDTINESYATAEEDSPTRYLSVLDTTNEMSLENLNITLTNPKLEVEETENYITEEILEQPDESSNDQVVVFSVEGSDELFGIQIVQDEEGNMQKYQFQFRKNENGQLEAIPETITLIPIDEDIPQGISENLETNTYPEPEEENTQSMHIFVEEDNSHEHILPDNIEEQEQQNQGEDDLDRSEMYQTENQDVEEETVDIKPGILALQSVKQEIQEHHMEYNVPETIEDLPQTFSEALENQQMTTFEQPHENIEQPEENLIEYHTEMSEPEQTEENSMSSEPPPHLEYHHEREPEEVTQDSVGNVLNHQEYEHVEVNPDVNIPHDENIELQEETEDFNNESVNDSDENDYQIVEGLHITGDMEGAEIIEQTIEKQTINNTNILKHALSVNKDQHKIIKKDNKLYLYVVQHPEKENVDSLTLDMSNLCRPKVNPRSILKSSHAMFQSKNEIENDQQDERLNKRFARCKEAMQARIFHNFINKTTIPQAPVRKNRLPRKQKIKPVERMDEEIVVQEVMVSSNGFVEAVGGRGVNKENLAVTDYVVLTDSDDDYDPKKVSRKKKKHRRKRIEITISDESDASHDSVIELDESDEEKDKQIRKEDKTNGSTNNNNNTPTKRRRGRPPKNKISEDSPSKKTRLEMNDEPKKPEIPCPKCDKTFPSQNSLKTHLQHHSLQSSIKRALPEYKYKCDSCGTSFINNILLKKHMCSKLFNCSICKKKFSDLPSLNAHKRIHAKEQMVKSTSTVQVSPKKIKPVQPQNPFKAPKTNTFKCKTCGKLCSSLQNLNVHIRTHKEYLCQRCSLKFVSQLMLEQHLREKCVKSPQRSRTMLHIGRKSPINVSRPRMKSATNLSRKSPKARMSMNTLKAKCDKCPMVFGSHQALFKHKVVIHGLDTPDKSILKKEAEEKKGHGGIPAASKLKDAYAELRVQLDFDD